MKVIYLNKDQAEKVRGRHGKYSELQPVEHGGMFILPVDVLDDPEHQEVINELGECKFAEIDITEVVEKEESHQVVTYKELSPVSIAVEKAMTVKPIYEKIKGVIKK